MKTFFDKNGYVIEDIFQNSEIEKYISSLKNILKIQCKKMSIEYDDDIFLTAKSINQKLPRALDEAFLTLRNSSEGHMLASNEIIKSVSSELLNKNENDILVVSGPSFFINFPNENTRKYTWHSEQNWYPKRRNFLNVWCPIIVDRTNNNSMELKIGSHKEDWFYFSEYSGYEGELNQNTNYQYEIPDKLIVKYESVIPNVKRGQGLFFDGKTVHRSIDNYSENPYFTIVFRVFDYSNDLTLSSDWADLPYVKKSLGYPNINVE
jgi:hypothetical protein